MQAFWLDDSEYLLTDGEAKQVDEADDRFPNTPEGNKGFNDWFREFVTSRHIRPINKRLARYWTKASNSKSDTVKAAVTLRAIRSIVSVVDPHHNLSVEYNSDADTSWWDDKKVVVPTRPVQEADDLYDAINVMGGFAIHEADHSKYTRKLLKTTTKFQAQEFLEDPINKVLSNLLEDERIESIEMQENPGFRSYLNNTRDWILKDAEKREVHKVPETWDECKGAEKLTAAIMAVRYPERAVEALKHPSFQPVMSEVKRISDKYTGMGEDVDFKGMQRAIASLIKALDITPEDREEVKKEGTGDPGKLQPCAHKADSPLSKKEADEIEGLVDEEVERLDTDAKRWAVSPEDRLEIPTITVMRPKYRGSRLPKIDNLLNKAKAALEFRKAIPRADERMMSSGELDEDELYRLFQNDMRVFRDISEDVLPSACVYLLVDLSGSMSMGFGGDSSETRREVAIKVAYLLVQGMKSKPNVTVRVLAHTGDNDDKYTRKDYGGSATFYRVWEEGDPINRVAVMNEIRPGENYDSFAVAWAGGLLAQESADQKLMIVLSDGEPAGRMYGGENANGHVRKHVDLLMRKGIDVISLSVSTALPDYRQAEMYKHWIPAKRGTDMYSFMLKQLQRVLLKIGSR